jgi:hypothetical protein
MPPRSLDAKYWPGVAPTRSRFVGRGHNTQAIRLATAVSPPRLRWIEHRPGDGPPDAFRASPGRAGDREEQGSSGHPGTEAAFTLGCLGQRVFRVLCQQARTPAPLSCGFLQRYLYHCVFCLQCEAFAEFCFLLVFLNSRNQRRPPSHPNPMFDYPTLCCHNRGQNEHLTA